MKPNESIEKQLLLIIKEFIKVPRHEISIQLPIVFAYTITA